MKKGDKFNLVFIIIVLFYITSTLGFPTDPTTLSDWPMFGRNMNHTSYYPDSINMTNFGVLWNYSTKGSIAVSSPSIFNDVVYIGSLDHNLYAINATNGSKIWNYSTGDYIVYSTPEIINDIVYVGSADHNLYAINATNGSKLWNYSATNSISSSPASANDIIYVGSYDNNLYAINATNGSKIWNYLTGDHVYSSPAIKGGIVYFGSYDKKVYALNATDGSQIWSYTTGANVSSSPAIANDIIYIGSGDSKLYALNATDGNLIWGYTTGGSVSSLPAIANGMVYVGSFDNKFYALNATDGSKIWEYATQNFIWSSPAVTNNIVYFGGWDSKIYALNATNGSKIWDHMTGRYIASSPAIADDTVYIGSYDGKLYALSQVSSDTIPPSVNVTYPINNTNFTSQTIRINYTRGDNVFIDSCWYSNDTYTVNRSLGSGGNCADITNITWSYKQHNVTVWANDTFGNVGSSKVTFTVNCIESWTCTDWGYCSAGTQTRTCTDSKSCGTTSSKPAESQSCDVAGPSTSQTESVPTVTPDQPAEIIITNPEIGVTSITITTTEEVQGETIKVEEIKDLPSAEEVLKKTPEGKTRSGKAYKSFRINLKKIKNNKIKEATINFKVNKQFLKRNNGTLENIRLFRRNDTTKEWEILPTFFDSEDDNFVYFRSVTPGFSTFVVFFSQYECVPNVRRCFENNVQLCLGNSTWLVTEQCQENTCEGGECKTVSKVVELLPRSLLAAGISFTVAIVLFLIWTRIKKRFIKK